MAIAVPLAMFSLKVLLESLISVGWVLTGSPFSLIQDLKALWYGDVYELSTCQ
jgi:hypothetical protein